MKKISILIIFLLSSLVIQAQDPDMGIIDYSYQARNVQNTIDLQTVTYGNFNGADNYVSVLDNDNLDFGTAGFSVDIFFYINSTTGTHEIVSKKQTGNGYVLYYNGAGLILYNYANTTNYTLYANTGLYKKKIHLILTFNGTTALTYIDGFLKSSTNMAAFNLSNTGALRIGNDGGTYFNGYIYYLRIYNKVLSASEVFDLYNNGRPDLYKIPYGDRWGSQTAVYTSNFGAGADSWANTYGGLSALDGNIDGIAGEDNVLRATSDATTGAHGFWRLNTVTSGKKYKVTFKYYIPSSNITLKRLYFYAGENSAVQTTVDAWTSVSIEASASLTNIRFIAANSAGNTSFAGTAGDVFYVKDVVVTPIGAVAYYKFNEGNGYQVKDYSSNALHGTVNGTNYPSGWGYSTFWMNPVEQYTQEYKFADEGISASAATTALFKIVPKVRLIYLDVGVDTAFTAGDTIWVKDASGNILATLGNPQTAGTRNLTLTNTYAVSYLTEKQIYIQKNRATTAGYLRLAAYFQCFREETR